MAKPAPFLSMIIVFCVSFAVYFNALFNGFVHDDIPQVVNNPWIKEFRYIPEMFSSNVWSFMGGTTNYYRPLMHIIYMITYHVFGLSPWGFHLVNIVLHGFVSVLVYLIIAELLRESGGLLSPPFIGALLFAANPIHTEVVTWVAGMPELSFTFFYLLSFYLYMRSPEWSSWRYPFSVVSFALGTLCKETALTLPIVLVVYDLAFIQGKALAVNTLKKYIPYAAITLAYFALRFNALEGVAPVLRHRELSDYQYFINVFPLFVQYLVKLLFPVNLNAFHILHPIASIFELKGVLSVIATVTFIALTLLFLKKDKITFFGLIIIGVPLLPALYIPGVGENTFAERYLYLPSVGFVLMLALFMVGMISKPRGAIFTAVTLSLIVCLYSTGTLSRNGTWKDNYTFWTDTVKQSPDGATPHYNYANNLMSLRMIDEAIAQYQAAISLRPTADEYYNLGNAYDAKGRLDQAVEQYKQALILNPEDADSYNNLGFDYEQMGLIDKAIENFEIAVRLNPEDPFFRGNLARVYERKNAEKKSRAEK